MECETKLYYTGKSEYPNKKQEDPFLMALAEGRYQVGELAKQYYPGGVEVKTLDKQDALKQAMDLLNNENITIYKAAIKYKNSFIRIDILEKIYFTYGFRSTYWRKLQVAHCPVGYPNGLFFYYLFSFYIIFFIFH